MDSGTLRTAEAPTNDALVSVIIACYRQAHFLGQAIESVLSQTHPQQEVVVVDDGSADNTREIAEQYPGVSYVRQSNQGLSAARNAGFRHSNGQFLAFLEADDRLTPNSLARALKASVLTRNAQWLPATAAISGSMACAKPSFLKPF